MVKSGYEYHCAAGESWDSIALKVYGNERYAADLLGMNPAMCHVLVFTGGERLALPTLEIQSDDAAVYTPANAPWKD